MCKNALISGEFCEKTTEIVKTNVKIGTIISLPTQKGLLNGIILFTFLYIALLLSPVPDITKGVLASSIKIESTSSTIAKSKEHWTFCSTE